MPVVMVHSYTSSSNGVILIVYSTCIRTSNSLDSFCLRVLIDFFDSIIFTNIDTYIACYFYFFFLSGVTVLVNTKYGYFPGFILVSKYFLS